MLHRLLLTFALIAGTAVLPARAEKMDPRGAELFGQWQLRHMAEVQGFSDFLKREAIDKVVPIYELLRSASMWKECEAEPFAVPPREQWPAVKDVLELLQDLRKRDILREFEVVSAYRGPALNRCSGGAPGSAHQRFAVDIAPLQVNQGVALCRYWHVQGKRWDMGLSRYPTGRVHIDRAGWRTWGASHGRGSSFCLADEPEVRQLRAMR